MKKVVIIGAGASGLVASIYASKNNEVILLEKNKSCGKKLLITGNGRCNYWNEDQNIKHYHSNNQELLKEIINEKNKNEILSFFDKLGIIPKIKNGYYYPFSNQAFTINHALVNEVIKNNVKIKTEYEVKIIKKQNDKFIINDETIADKLIIATGSIAYPKTGSTGYGYDVAKDFNHKIIPVMPSLVKLKGEEKYFKKWAGIRTDVIVSLYEDNNLIKQEEGEIQLTEDGISGICIFNISRDVVREQKNKKIKINFLPCLTKEELIKKLENKNIKETLERIINYKLVEVIMEISNIDENTNFNDLKEKDLLINNLFNFEFKVTGYNSFDSAQVCSGGVSLNEINLNTMESKLEKNLYFIGEILDVDGDCGGYNLGFAWISGMLAGKDND